MTEKDELIEVELNSVLSICDMEEHWDEPEPYAWAYPQAGGGPDGLVDLPPVRGLVVFHVDVLNNGAEDVFRNKHADLFDRLAAQGVETMVVGNKKHGGDMGVRVEYINLWQASGRIKNDQ